MIQQFTASIDDPNVFPNGESTVDKAIKEANSLWHNLCI